MNIPLVIGLAGIVGVGVLISRVQGWRHDTTLRRLDRAPLPNRIPGASLRWERHVADALGVARATTASDFAEWEAQMSGESESA